MTAYTLHNQGNYGFTGTAGGVFEIGTEFEVATPVALTGIWLYSPAGATELPTECGIWNIGTTSLVADTHNTSPSWSGAAGSGWVKCAYDGSVTLTPGTQYVAAVYDAGGASGWHATLSGYWTTGAGASGISNGPLSAPGSSTAVNGQAVFNSGSFAFPASTTGGFDFGVDVEVTGSGTTSYSLWFQDPTVANGQVLNDGGATDTATLATQFSVSQAASLNAIWFYTPTFSGTPAPALPAECGIWDVTLQTLVAGTHLTSPAWSGAAGSGWVKASYNGSVTLAAGRNYVTSVFYNAGGSGTWYASNNLYWSSGAGASGITSGPLNAPNNAASVNGQSPYNNSSGVFAFPATTFSSYNYWVDVQVTPAATPPPPAQLTVYSMRMMP